MFSELKKISIYVSDTASEKHQNIQFIQWRRFSKTIGGRFDPTGDRSYPPEGDIGTELSAVDSNLYSSHIIPMKVRSKTRSPLSQKSFFTFFRGSADPQTSQLTPLSLSFKALDLNCIQNTPPRITQFP